METKQPQTSPAQTRENIMGTMEINPLLVKLSVPMMISMLVQAAILRTSKLTEKRSSLVRAAASSFLFSSSV